jgi:hypothetical protein
LAATDLTPVELERLRELEESADYVREVRSDSAAMEYLARPRKRMPRVTADEFRRRYLDE